MQYIKNADGTFGQLPKKNVDFGGGLERILMATHDQPDVVAINHQSIVTFLEERTGKVYGAVDEETRAFRIVADHMKAAVFLIADGVYPTNTDQGYFVRRLLRRAIRYADKLGMTNAGISEVVEAIVPAYEVQYPMLRDTAKEIQDVIDEEERKFRLTLVKGLREFEKITEAQVTGEQAFRLFSTYGFPLELTLELASEQGKSVDTQSFADEMRRHQEVSRAGSEQKFKGGLADTGAVTTQLHTCTHLMLAGLRKYLGPDVHQAGSNITAERTRFDFTYPEKVQRDILDKVEAYVNEAIAKKCPMTVELMKKSDAKAAGVEGSFWEKYPDEVHVYAVRCSDGTVYSQELCGGPHVANTGEITGTFAIVKEEASSAGVRRVKGVLQA